MLFLSPVLFFLLFFLMFYSIKIRTSPYVYALAGGIAAHMALLAGHNASSLPKGLAVAWPVNLLAPFLYATVITSAAYLGYLYIAAKRVNVGDALALGLCFYNWPYALSISTAVYSLPQYSPMAPYLLYIGLSALAAVEAFLLRAISSSLKVRVRLWPLALIAFPAGYYSYYVLPPLAVDVTPHFFTATFYAAAAALIVYSMFRNNIVAASLMGGLSSFKFWSWLFAGVMIYAAVEVPILLYHPGVHNLLHAA